MDQRNLTALFHLKAVVEAGSFTRAAKKLGKAQSGISQAVSELEKRVGTPLLARTTRSVRPTEAGRRLLETVSPALRQIEAGFEELQAGAEQVCGALRLTAMEYPARALLIPALKSFFSRYPRVTIDLEISDRLTDIVSEGFDAGLRMGAQLELDMIALPLGGDLRAAIVAAPDYFARFGKPRQVDDLANHACLNFRMATHGDLYRWRLSPGEKSLDVSVGGSLTVNDAPVMIEAAMAGLGLAYTLEPHVRRQLEDGRLESCLEEACPIWEGYRLYYPSRTQKSAALAALIDHLKASRAAIAD